jgi:regulator of ribonuclease activity A
MVFNTSDLCDQFPERVRVATPLFRHFGARRKFAGQIVTIKCHEDNVLIREAVLTPGQGKVLVVDGGGSLRSALVGDGVADWAREHGWAGMVINGCVRDTEALAKVEIGVLALGVNPWQPGKRGQGIRDIPVTFADVRFAPDEWLYADEDGIVVCDRALNPSEQV